VRRARKAAGLQYEDGRAAGGISSGYSAIFFAIEKASVTLTSLLGVDFLLTV